MAGKAPKQLAEAPQSTEALAGLTYEQAFAELETLVESMEDGKLALEQSVAAYKRGAELAALCQQRLQAAEQQVRVLEEGLLKPFSVAGAA